MLLIDWFSCVLSQYFNYLTMDSTYVFLSKLLSKSIGTITEQSSAISTYMEK